MRLTHLVTTAALVSLTVACGTDTGPSRVALPTAAARAAASPSAPLPKPTEAPILVIRGAGKPNIAGEVRLDAVTLDAIAQAEWKIREPFVKRDVLFTGIPMSELLARAGVTSGTVRLHALDDYTVDMSVKDLAHPAVMLATKADGAPMPVAAGGPIRLVFDASSPVGHDQKLWIWSLDSMTVR